MEDPDKYVKEVSEEMWRIHLRDEAERAKQWELDNYKTIEELKAMSGEEYLNIRYYARDDKHGLRYMRNMVASGMQSAKSKTGKSLETAVNALFNDRGIVVTDQPNINAQGDIQKSKSVHRADCCIASSGTPTSIRDTYVISKKNTLRERWNQDLWCIPLCKQLIILTRETPNASTIASIGAHGAVVVYPNAPITGATWSYSEFLRRMKDFQK